MVHCESKVFKPGHIITTWHADRAHVLFKLSFSCNFLSWRNTIQIWSDEYVPGQY